jgi:hypothetical protein
MSLKKRSLLFPDNLKEIVLMNTIAMNTSTPLAALHRPWWKEPFVWLVIGGPLIVVVAGIFTAYIAMKDPDPVINTKQQHQKLLQQELPAGAAPNKDDMVKLLPAGQARNHAASPVVPDQAK